jgi:hypothetical protein
VLLSFRILTAKDAEHAKETPRRTSKSLNAKDAKDAEDS